jgi:fructokinase
MIIGCLGEVIVDYIGLDGAPLAETRTFRQCPGGAAANVAVGLRTLGVEPLVLSKVGNDPAGRFLRAELERAGVSTHFLAIDPTRPTRRAFIAYDAEGRREIDIVYRQSADQTLTLHDVAGSQFDALHVIGTAFLGEITGATALALADRVRAGGGWVSLDPNIPLERITPEAQQRIVAILEMVDILACGSAEWAWISSRVPVAPALLIRTDGSRGATLRAGPVEAYVPPPDVACTDPTGAGDAFVAGCISVLTRSSPHAISRDDLEAMGRAGAANAAQVIGAVGAIAGYRSQSARDRP